MRRGALRIVPPRDWGNLHAHIPLDISQDEGSLSDCIQYTHNKIRAQSSMFIQGNFFQKENGMHVQLYYTLHDERRINQHTNDNLGFIDSLIDKSVDLVQFHNNNATSIQSFVDNQGRELGTVKGYEVVPLTSLTIANCQQNDQSY